MVEETLVVEGAFVVVAETLVVEEAFVVEVARVEEDELLPEPEPGLGNVEPMSPQRTLLQVTRVSVGSQLQVGKQDAKFFAFTYPAGLQE